MLQQNVRFKCNALRYKQFAFPNTHKVVTSSLNGGEGELCVCRKSNGRKHFVACSSCVLYDYYLSQIPLKVPASIIRGFAFIPLVTKSLITFFCCSSYSLFVMISLGLVYCIRSIETTKSFTQNSGAVYVYNLNDVIH